jgi:hypothetical protein
VLLISNLRTDPRVADNTRQAILCPADSVEYLMQQTVEDLVWYRVRVLQLAADRNAQRAPAGTEGWASSKVVSAPSGPVAAATPSLTDKEIGRQGDFPLLPVSSSPRLPCSSR